MNYYNREREVVSVPEDVFRRIGSVREEEVFVLEPDIRELASLVHSFVESHNCRNIVGPAITRHNYECEMFFDLILTKR